MNTLLEQYKSIINKIELLKAEDIINDPEKQELLNKLEQTLEELGKLYNV